ncbi:hypothetical protein PSPO_a0925 [Pseudoalteromonas spongiae UST010723-006]|nr:hypothetical protein PSPO_a0925 [Pseudoalteromonas spongiae UST010723-006]
MAHLIKIECSLNKKTAGINLLFFCLGCKLYVMPTRLAKRLAHKND